MTSWRIALNIVLLFSLVFLIACRFDPFGSFPGDNSPGSSLTQGLLGLTPEQITQVIDDIKNKKATLPVSLEVPAYSFYRFDYSNAAGGHRGSTIISHAQAVASPPYGIETTARVLIYEAMKAKAGYSIDYFALSNNLPTDRVMPVITAISAQYSDTEFMLRSSQNIASAPTVAQAISDLIGTLPVPPQADFTPIAIASPAVNLDLKPDFSTLPATTLTTLFLNPELRDMYASMSEVGLANYSLFKSNVPATSKPNPSIRFHVTSEEHDISTPFWVGMAPISASGSVTASFTTIDGAPPVKLEQSSVATGQQIAFLYQGDRGLTSVFTGAIKQLRLEYTFRDKYKKGSCGKEETGPEDILNSWSSPTVQISSVGSTTPIAELLCSVIVDNQAIATFTARSKETVTTGIPLLPGQTATLACYLVPPEMTVADLQARSHVDTILASGIRPLTASETAGWWKVVNPTGFPIASVTTVPTMFRPLFQPIGTYMYTRSMQEFTPQVFTRVAAPATSTISLDLSRFPSQPVYAFSLPVTAPPRLDPMPIVLGLASGVFNTSKTFSITVADGAALAYSLDEGTTWVDYSGPVTLDRDGVFRIVARNKNTNATSSLILVTIDTIAPAAPTITGITAGTFSGNQTFSITGAEASGTLYFSLDGGTTAATYTGPIVLSDVPRTYQVTAWQRDEAGNLGTRSTVIALSLVTPVSVTAVSPSSALNTGILSGVQISGTGFASGTIARLTRPGSSTVSGTAVTVPSTTTLSCSFDLSGLASGPWNVEVTTLDGLSATGTGLFTVTAPAPAPTVTAVTPATASNTGLLSRVQVSGTGFTSGLTTRLTRTGHTPVSASALTINSATSLTCAFDLTGLATGSWNIEVTNPDNQIGTGSNLLTIVAPVPSLTAIQPATGINNAVLGNVQVSGAWFVNGATARLTRTGQSPVSASSVVFTSAAQLVCSFDLTGLATGNWNVEVTNPDGQTATGSSLLLVTTVTSPTVTSISTTTGTNNTTLSNVLVTGTQFVTGATVRLIRSGQSPVVATSVTVTSSSQLSCSFNLTGIATGSWTIEVTNPDSQVGIGSSLLTVTAPAPIVSAASPSTASNTGTLNGVQVNGVGFMNGATAHLTRSGSSPVPASSVTVTSSSQLSCSFNLTGIATGSWNLEVTNPDNQTGTGSNLLTIVAPVPSVSAILPATGENDKVLGPVQVSGAWFVNGASVRLTRSGQAPVTASSVTFTNATTLSCSFNLNGLSTGLWNVEVVNPDGQTATGANLLTVTGDLTAPAAPVFGVPTIQANLAGLGNRADQINSAVKAAMNQFQITLRNDASGAENGTLDLRLIDSLGITVLNTPMSIASGAALQNYGGFALGALSGLSTGSITIKAVVIDLAGNRSATASITLTDCFHEVPTVTLTSVPPASSDLGSATITVSGSGISSYKSRFDGIVAGPNALSTQLILASITPGLHTLEILPSTDGNSWAPWSWATTATFTVSPWRLALDFGRTSSPASSADLVAPFGVAVAPTGKIHVVDCTLKLIKVYSSTGAYESSYGGNATMTDPCGIAFDPSGNAWVADSMANTVVKFSSTGTLLASYPVSAPSPRYLAFNAAGSKLAISCKSSYAVLICTPTNMQNNPQFFTIGSPEGLAFDSADNLLVADSISNYVMVITPSSSMSYWGSSGTGVGLLSNPTAMTIGADGNAYIYDNQKRIQKFTPTGNYLGAITSVSFDSPACLAVPNSGELFLTNSGSAGYVQKLVWP